VNAATEDAAWRAELLGWAVRGGACALPSACWAVLAGYRAPIHGVAMAAGVAAYVVVFAAGCHRGERRHSPWPAHGGPGRG